MHAQELSARDSLYGQVGAFFDDQLPKIIDGTASRMSTGEIPLYFCQPLDPGKVYSLGYDTENLNDIPQGTFFGEQDVSLNIKFVSLDEKRPVDGQVSAARTLIMFIRQAGENYVRPYDAQHPLTSWAIGYDAARGLGAMYKLILSPEAPPTVISHDHLPLPSDREKPRVATDNPWETVRLLQEEDYEPYEINDDEAVLVLRTLTHLATTKKTEHLYNESLAQFYCGQMVYPGVTTMGMFMRPKE